MCYCKPYSMVTTAVPGTSVDIFLHYALCSSQSTQEYHPFASFCFLDTFFFIYFFFRLLPCSRFACACRLANFFFFFRMDLSTNTLARFRASSSIASGHFSYCALSAAFRTLLLAQDAFEGGTANLPPLSV